MAQMRAPDGRVLDIVEAGVNALEALGWEQTDAKASASGPLSGLEDAPATATHTGAPETQEAPQEADEDDTSEADETEKPAPKRATRRRS